MEGEYFSVQPKNEQGLEQSSEKMSIDEACIMGLYNDSISYLSLLNSEPPLQQHQNNHSTEKRKKVRGSVSETARKRRLKIAEKIKCLEKLLPWSTKMSTSTMLEEAAKYVKFLQAQICVLKSMPPCYSSSSKFEKQVLNREEFLGFMLNSKEIQTVLSKDGLCLCTAEQMASLLDNTLLHGIWNYY